MSISIWFLACVFFSPAYAANDNPLLLPVGEQEALMGNTGIALGASPANVLYNPAGVSDLDGKRLSVSGSTYALIKATLEVDSSSDDLSFSSFNAVPNMVVGSRKVGGLSVAYGIFSPSMMEIDADFDTFLQNISADARQALTSRIQEQFVGAAVARRFAKNWRGGFSVFGHRYNERVQSSTQATPTGAASPVSPYVAGSERIMIEVISIQAILGVQHEMTDSFRWGARVALPGIPVFDRSEVYQEILVYDGTSVSKAVIDRDDFGAEYKLPLDVGAGMLYRTAGGHEFALDAAVQFGTSYTNIPDSTRGFEIELATTLRSSAGFKYRWNDANHVVAGLNWNPSTIKSSRRLEDDSGNAPQNFILATAGIYHQAGNVLLAGGAFYGFSRTDRAFFEGEPENRTNIRAMGLILSTSILY
jgi:long-subunit fatty acid transport protein